MTPEELRAEWRNGQGQLLRNRRSIVGLSLLSVACMSLISLYQTGALKKVPEPPGFDAEKVNGSDLGYSLLGTPDALLAVGSYTGTALLAAVGPSDRDRQRPWLSLAFGGKAFADAVLASVLLVAQPVKYKAFSFWSVLSAGAVLRTAWLALPEAKSAWQQIKKKTSDPG